MADVPTITCYCGKVLPITDAMEWPWPLSPGNPYPEPAYTCHEMPCQVTAQEDIDEAYQAIQDQVDPMVAEGDLENDNMYR